MKTSRVATSTAKPERDFLETLEKGVREVLSGKGATPEQKIQAINAGSKLLQIKHKITGMKDDDTSFFGGKNGQ